MWFMIKGTFWFSLVLMALPFLNPDPETAEREKSIASIDVSDSISAAITAIEDLRQICERKPDVCDKGAETINALGLRARDGAEVAFKLLDQNFASAGSPQSAPDPILVTGSLPDSNRIPIPTFIR